MREDMQTQVLWKGVVRGTPRTYGDTKNDDIWRRAIVDGQWEGASAISTLQISVHLDFEFRVNPASDRYHRNVSSTGPDLATMVIGALGGLLNCRNPQRPTLRLIQHGGLCRLLTASKSVVDSDDLAGFTLHVRSGEVVPFESWPSNCGLSFPVGRHSLRGDRRRAVQEAAERANHNGYRA